MGTYFKVKEIFPSQAHIRKYLKGLEKYPFILYSTIVHVFYEVGTPCTI